jgi:hypothetical protein
LRKKFKKKKREGSEKGSVYMCMKNTRKIKMMVKDEEWVGVICGYFFLL